MSTTPMGEPGTAAGSPTTPDIRAALESAEFALSVAVNATSDDRSWYEEACKALERVQAALTPPASPEPERCGCPAPGDDEGYMPPCRYGCKDPLTCRFPHPGCDHCRRVRGGQPAPSAPSVEALRERLHDAICTMPKPHGCHAYEALRALESAARADERTRLDAPLTVDYGDTTCPETHVDGYCNACGPLDLSAFLSRGAALLERVEWENPDDEAAAERWVNRASFAALAEQGR